MKETKDYNYKMYDTSELRNLRNELQRQIQAIQFELESRRGSVMKDIKQQLQDIFDEAKEYGIAIEIGTQETYISYNPAEDTITDIEVM